MVSANVSQSRRRCCRAAPADLKTQNVLLQADSADPRGFICKIADFGTARLLRAGQVRTDRAGRPRGHRCARRALHAGVQGRRVRSSPSRLRFPVCVQDDLLVTHFGTVTHQPPETIRDNTVSLKGDVYAFGVLMWWVACMLVA